MNIKDKTDRFESINEFYDNIERGGEVEFSYKERDFSITHSGDGIHFIEANNYESERIFKNAKELGEFEVLGEKIKDLIIIADIRFRCF